VRLPSTHTRWIMGGYVVVIGALLKKFRRGEHLYNYRKIKCVRGSSAFPLQSFFLRTPALLLPTSRTVSSGTRSLSGLLEDCSVVDWK